MLREFLVSVCPEEYSHISWLIVPTLKGTPNTSSIACCVVRFDKRYAPVHSATVACTRGPYVLLGTPAGQGARVVAPHDGHAS